MIKYLYGKKQFLELIKIGSASPRFSHISHYETLENENIRDKETSKKFKWKKNEGEIFINGHHISNNSLASDPEISMNPRLCYCLCLSSTPNSIELYKRFDADYCLAINVNTLMSYLDATFGTEIGHLKFINSDVTYYSEYDDLLHLTPEQVVFYKQKDTYHIEVEHRIAIFYPLTQKGFHTLDGNIIPFESDTYRHIQCNIMDGYEFFWKDIVVDYFEYKAP